MKVARVLKVYLIFVVIIIKNYLNAFLLEEIASSRAITPDFPLIPASKGFCLTLIQVLEGFHQKLKDIKAIT
jgi:hypothetical protein